MAIHRLRPCRLWRFAAFAAVLYAVVCPAGSAKETSTVKEAEQFVADSDLKAALITLKNAIRKAPQDPAVRMQAARLYLQLGDVRSAEREARAARELKADEADYLPTLIDALLRQRKFRDLYDLVEPGDREPVLEGKVRTALGIAAVRLGYDTRAEALLRDAIKLDPRAAEPRIQVARFLNEARPAEADQVIDEAIAANPQAAELLQVKGEMQWSRGDAAGALQLFGKALEIDPKYQLARLSRANVNVIGGDFVAADADLDPDLAGRAHQLHRQLSARPGAGQAKAIRRGRSDIRPHQRGVPGGATRIFSAGRDKAGARPIRSRREHFGQIPGPGSGRSEGGAAHRHRRGGAARRTARHRIPQATRRQVAA